MSCISTNVYVNSIKRVHRDTQKMSSEASNNHFVASLVFLAAIQTDAVSALDPAGETDFILPILIRLFALAFIALTVFLPSICAGEMSRIGQQAIFVVALAVTALVGNHQAASDVRIVDLILTFVVGATIILANAFWARKTSDTLVTVLIFYANLLNTRQSFRYTENVVDASNTVPDWTGNKTVTLPGYGLSSIASILALGFGSTVGATLAVFMLVDPNARTRRMLLLICGFLQFSSAFWATVALSDQQQELSVLFSASACASEACPAAGSGRRLGMLNGGSATLWLTSLGTFILAYEPNANSNSNSIYKATTTTTTVTTTTAATQQALSSPIVVVWGALSTVACAAVVFAYSSFEGQSAYIEVSTLVSLVGVTAAAFWNNEFGSLVFTAGIVYDEWRAVQSNSLLTILTYLTHCSIFIGTLTLLLRTIVVIVVDLGWSVLGPRITDRLDDIVGVLTIAGTSIFTFLYFATVVLVSTYNGLLLGPESYEDGPNGYARSMVAAVLEHWLPILIFLPLYRSRQVTNLSTNWKIGIWIGAVAVAVSLWASALTVAGRDADHADAYSWGNQIAFVISIFVTCVAPWAAVVMV